MIAGNKWRCDICGKTYITTGTIQLSIIHDGKTYCLKCDDDWSKKQQQIIEDNLRKQEMERKKLQKQRMAAFEANRIQNGEYQPGKGGRHAVVAAGLITLDHPNKNDYNETLWAGVYGDHIKCYRTLCTSSEFSGYHDEYNDYYGTTVIQTLPMLKAENWFEGEKWLQKTAVPHSANSLLDLDSLYYEGHGKATTTRWKTRWYAHDTKDGSLIIWLRRCTEGWRLLRISLYGTVIPFDFDFREETVPILFDQYAAKCYVFQDFLLTREECAYIADGLLNIKHNTFEEAYKPSENSISFIRRSERNQTEESSLPQMMLGELLRIRCLNEEDYWERRVNPDIEAD